MGCAHKENEDGFTLVEISIVMIIIGLLIGGTFGGMKLIENMQVNKTVQDLKAIESAALTFRDTYGRLPGDMPNTAARLPSCTDAPCATGGNGDRQISPVHPATGWQIALNTTWERYTFWHHLQAANMLTMDFRNSLDPAFGEGQPSAPIGGGYRISNYTGNTACSTHRGAIVTVSSDSSAAFGTSTEISCAANGSIDRKMDDGSPFLGKVLVGGTNVCVPLGVACGNPYAITGNTSAFWYDVGF